MPRRLTQVNTQISIPFVYSSKGYGLLWHNYGLTDFNPADRRIELVPERAEGAASTVEVSTTDGTKTEVRQFMRFVGRFTAAKSGRHALFLERRSEDGATAYGRDRW